MEPAFGVIPIIAQHNSRSAGIGSIRVVGKIGFTDLAEFDGSFLCSGNSEEPHEQHEGKDVAFH
jgi:hypothetical protein